MKSFKKYLPLIILITIFLLIFVSPVFLQIFHHYLNFLSIGRSETKVIGILCWLFLIFILEIFPQSLKEKILSKLKFLDHHLLIFILIGSFISFSSNFLSFLILKKYSLPLDTQIYAVSKDFNFSFNHLTHTHFLKPSVGFLEKIFPKADFGKPWKEFFQENFFISKKILDFFYFLILIFLIILSITFLFYSLKYQNIFLKLILGIATFSFLKNILDGGFLTTENLLSLSFLLFLFFRKTKLALILLIMIFLLYPLRFTNYYLNIVSLTTAFFLALFLFSLNPKNKSEKVLVKLLGLFLIFGFFYFGKDINFFEQSFDLKNLFNQDSKKENSLCSKSKNFEALISGFQILGKDMEKISDFFEDEKIKASKEKIKEKNMLILRTKTCLDDPFKEALIFLKKQFPEEKVILVANTLMTNH